MRERLTLLSELDDLEIQEIWRSSETGGMIYTLAKVPDTLPIRLDYSEAAKGLDYKMTPTENPKEWTMQGIIDLDIVQALGLKTMQSLSEFGKVSVVEEDGFELLDVALTLPIEKMNKLIRKLWAPKTENRKNFSLQAKNGVRIIPERFNIKNESQLKLTVLPRSPRKR